MVAQNTTGMPRTALPHTTLQLAPGGTEPPARIDFAKSAACLSVDALVSWASVVATTPATGALVTPQKPGRAGEGSTGGTGKAPAPKLILEQVMAADLTRGLRTAASTEGSGTAEPGSKRHRTQANEDHKDEMVDSDADFEN